MVEKLYQKLADYEEVITKGNYITKAKNQLNIMFHGFFYRFETFTDVIGDNQENSLYQFVQNDSLEKIDLNLTHFYDDSLIPDAFVLKVKASGDIDISSNNLRGFHYAMEAFKSLFEKWQEEIVYPIVEIKHQPSFEIRGVIEGFYGEPWTHDTRKDVIRFLSKERMNTYMYAPKDDELQRKKWREFYSKNKLVEFSELIQLADEKDIDFYYMISPGNDIDYTIESEVKVLTDKLTQLIDLGVNHFGLLLDDIDYVLKGNIKKRFSTAAKAHGFLIMAVDTFLKNQLAEYSLVICPTEYDNKYNSPYLSELTELVSNHIPFFWTGPSTLASQISEKNIKEMSQVLNRPLIIWDNIPVNDYLTDKECLFLSPYENRSKKLAKKEMNVSGVVANPMSQWEPSKLTIQNMSQFLWNAETFQVIPSWEKTISTFVDESAREALRVFSSFCPNTHTRNPYSMEDQMNLKAGNKEYISSCVNELVNAVHILEKESNQRFNQEVNSWYNRAHEDQKLWQLILEEKNVEAREKSEALQKSPCRFSRDLVTSYINKHL